MISEVVQNKVMILLILGPGPLFNNQFPRIQRLRFHKKYFYVPRKFSAKCKKTIPRKISAERKKAYPRKISADHKNIFMESQPLDPTAGKLIVIQSFVRDQDPTIFTHRLY